MAKTYYENAGNQVSLEESGFQNLISYELQRDSETGALYTVVRVPQTDQNGNKQYPFTIWPNYPSGGIQSTLEMNRERKFLVAINGAGICPPYGGSVSESGEPIGILIQNGVLLKDHSDADPVCKTLTIDGNGTLGYEKQSVTAAQLLAKDVISTISGYYPLVYNYNNIDNYESDVADHIANNSTMTGDAQRQAICQYENGDYLIITSEGRGFGGGGYFTARQFQRLCKSYGVKFAYMLDGGGSAQTVIGQKQLNCIYERTYGRVMPSYIVFNGTTTFKITNT